MYVSYIRGCKAVVINSAEAVRAAVNADFEAYARYFEGVGVNQLNLVSKRYGKESLGKTLEDGRTYTENKNSNRESTLARMLYYDPQNQSVTMKIDAAGSGSKKENNTGGMYYGMGGAQADSFSYGGMTAPAWVRIAMGGNGDDRFDLWNRSEIADSYEGGALILATLYNWLLEKYTPKPAQLILEELDDYVQMTRANRLQYITVGGKGYDTINGSLECDQYCYTVGDGFDHIFDYSGNDAVYIMGCSETDVEIIPYGSPKEENVGILIRIKGENAIDLQMVSFKGAIEVDDQPVLCKGMVRVFCGSPYDDEPDEIFNQRRDIDVNMGRSIQDLIMSVVSCPVNVEICDPQGNVVLTLQDGVPCMEEKEYGIFEVKQVDGVYVKRIMLADKDYSFRIRGLADGYMEYDALYFAKDDSGRLQSSGLTQIPVRAGCVFYPDTSSQEHTMKVDWNNDGTVDETISFAPEISFAKSEVKLAYGESTQLELKVEPATHRNAVMLLVDNEEVIDLCEDGRITAVGTGKATVYALSTNGDDHYAKCTITVPDTAIDMNSVTVTLPDESYIYRAEAIEPAPTLTYKNMTLKEDVHYSLQYENHTAAGTASVTITGLSPFSGTIKKTYVIKASTRQMTLEDKVREIADKCRASGAKSDYEIALWLHDYVIYNATYDFNFTSPSFTAEGILLHGRGVCEGYTEAYGLLLDEFGIPNMKLVSTGMDHGWNLIKLGDHWYHVDCTWDDPNMGGMENHNYFLLSDDMISFDHYGWNSNAPAADSNDMCNRPDVRIVSTDEEFAKAIDEIFRSGEKNVRLYSGDNSFNLETAWDVWCENDAYRYCLYYYTWLYEMTGSYLWFEFQPHAEGVMGATIKFNGDMEQLKADIHACLARGEEYIGVYDANQVITTEGYDFWIPDGLELVMRSIIAEFAGEQLCYLESSELYYFTNSVVSRIRYIRGENMPEPLPTITPVRGSEFEYDRIDGGTISLSQFAGQRFLMIYNNWYDEDIIFVSSLAPIFERANVKIVAVNLHTEDEEFRTLAAKYPNLIYAESSYSDAMWSDMSLAGINKWYVSCPLVFLYNERGEIIYGADPFEDQWPNLLSLVLSTGNLAGDANSNGAVEVDDALIILQYLAGWNVSINTENADVNGDGVIGLSDALKILQDCMGGDIAKAMRALQRMLTDLSTGSLKITQQPVDQYVMSGETATFTVTATGDGLNYQWYIDHSDGNGWQKLGNAVESTYVTSKVDADNDGYQYRCVITDAHGAEVTTDTAVLHVVLELPSTGDASHPMLWMALCSLSVTGFVLLLSCYKRSRRYC